jgi:hypothetical protein
LNRFAPLLECDKNEFVGGFNRFKLHFPINLTRLWSGGDAGANESLSVTHEKINSDEHDAKYGVRSGPRQPLEQEHRDKPGASSYQPGDSKKARESL